MFKVRVLLMQLGLFIVLMGFDSMALVAEENYGDLVVSRLISVYDGDTFKVDIDSLHPLIGKNVSIRVNFVDTPEIRGKCESEKELARVAQQFAEEMLRDAKVIELHNVQRDKYFRIVADVFADGVSLSSALLQNNLGYEYDGGKKKSWCH